MHATPMIGRSQPRRPEQILRWDSDAANDNGRFSQTNANDNARVEAAEKAFGRDVMAILEKHYPTHFWYVGVDFKQGIAHVRIPILMGPTAKYVLHLHRIANLPDLEKAVMEAGGHILERFDIPRAGLDFGLGQFLDARANKALTRPNQAMPG